jgi:hypothetical protein
MDCTTGSGPTRFTSRPTARAAASADRGCAVHRRAGLASASAGFDIPQGDRFAGRVNARCEDRDPPPMVSATPARTESEGVRRDSSQPLWNLAIMCRHRQAVRPTDRLASDRGRGKLLCLSPRLMRRWWKGERMVSKDDGMAACRGRKLRDWTALASPDVPPTPYERVAVLRARTGRISKRIE